MNDAEIHSTVAGYYTGKLSEHGPTPRGADWSTAESQQLRFELLLGVVDDLSSECSLLDYGCGYGALLSHLRARGLRLQYQGFDLAGAMVEAAAQAHPSAPGCFTSDEISLRPADYVVASGIFNVKLEVPGPRWHDYILATLDRLDALSLRGFSFNALTSYSDADRQRPDLHYADPCVLFDHCKRRFSRRVALLHDSPLWEFTIVVRKP